MDNIDNDVTFFLNIILTYAATQSNDQQANLEKNTNRDVDLLWVPWTCSHLPNETQ